MTTPFSLGNRQIPPYAPDAYPGARDSTLSTRQLLTAHYVYHANTRSYPRHNGRAPASSETHRPMAAHTICQ
jgi:hypothetical protein